MANSKKVQGGIMAAVGFALLIVNAAAAIFNWQHPKPAFTILGLVFVLIGLRHYRAK